MYITCPPAESLMPGPISQLFYDGLPVRNHTQYTALAASGSKQQQPQPFVFPQATEASTLQPLIPPPTPVPTEVSTPTELGEFASSVVYQMWHVKVTGSALVGQVPSSSPLPSQPANLSQTASSQFKNFCVQVLLQTQLSNTVVILSLKYVQRFVKSGRSVNFGEDGPEYRLFTIALMLANKFLDDNTFTNKTWSEVTSIPIKEINKMELAFLECMDFKMYVSGPEYSHWLECLKDYTKTQQQKYNHQRQRSSSDALNNVTLATAQNQHQLDNRPSRRSAQFNKESISYFDPTGSTLGQCMMPVSQLSSGMQKLSAPTTIGSAVVQLPAQARVQHAFSQKSHSPVHQALHNSYFGSVRGGDSSAFHHVKRHSMPTIDVVDQISQQQTSQFKLSNAYNSTAKLNIQQFKPSNVNSLSYHNATASANAPVTAVNQLDSSNPYGFYGNVGNNQRDDQKSHINHSTPVTNGLDLINAHHKPLPQLFDGNTKNSAPYSNINDQQLTTDSVPSANHYDHSNNVTSNQLSNNRSLPQLIRSTYPPPHGYPSQISDGLFINSSMTQSSDHLPLANTSIQSPDQYFSTPPLMHQKELGSRATQHKIGNMNSSNFGVSSNPPTPVDVPFNPMIQPTSSFRQVVGNSTHNTVQQPKNGQYYGSVQAQQGMNVVNMTGGGFVFPLLSSSNNNGSATQNFSTKRFEENGVSKNRVMSSFAPVMIAPPGLGFVGSFSTPKLTVQASRDRFSTTAPSRAVGPTFVPNMSNGGHYRVFDGITIA